MICVSSKGRAASCFIESTIHVMVHVAAGRGTVQDCSQQPELSQAELPKLVAKRVTYIPWHVCLQRPQLS